MTTLLSEHEQRMVAGWFREYDRAELIKYDPNGQLPLHGGGSTDLYINLRNVRNAPGSAELFASMYVHMIEILREDYGVVIKRLVECPHAISPLMPSISSGAYLPYTTIRDVPKEKHASGNAQIIGKPFFDGETGIIVDDVITRGGSLIRAYRIAMENGINILGALVLVDREGGWKEEFANNGVVGFPVWAGMTLTQLREHIKYHS